MPQGGARGLAVAVVTHAMKEMRGESTGALAVGPRGPLDRRRERIKACVWLGTSAASVFFDASGVEQRYALSHMGWAKHAGDILSAGVCLTLKEIRVLELGLDELGADT